MVFHSFPKYLKNNLLISNVLHIFARRLASDKTCHRPLELTLPYLALKLLHFFLGFFATGFSSARSSSSLSSLGHQGQMDCEPRSICQSCQCCLLFSQHFAILKRCSCIYKSPGLNKLTIYISIIYSDTTLAHLALARSSAHFFHNHALISCSAPRCHVQFPNPRYTGRPRTCFFHCMIQQNSSILKPITVAGVAIGVLCAANKTMDLHGHSLPTTLPDKGSMYATVWPYMDEASPRPLPPEHSCDLDNRISSCATRSKSWIHHGKLPNLLILLSSSHYK